MRTDAVIFGMGNAQRVPSLVEVHGKGPVLFAVLALAWTLLNVVGWHVAADLGWLPHWLAFILGLAGVMAVTLPRALFLQRRRRRQWGARDPNPEPTD